MEEIITSESVFQGHPDKICDQISDAILDACLEQDKESRVGIECAIKDEVVFLFGEITTNAKVNYSRIALSVLNRIGYKEPYKVHEKISKQSRDIALGVNRKGAGDQGMMYGYACNETLEAMPVPIVVAHKISRTIDNLRKFKYKHLFGPDGKCQVSVRYNNGKPMRFDTIVISAQTLPDVTVDDITPIIMEEVLAPLIGNLNNVRVLINPTGSFEKGGPYADSGLTGRKIIVDTYGGVAHHGGGAFSGKDCSKVDRSGAYFARYVAKSIVKAGLAEKCEICISYSIGICEPISIHIDTFGTGFLEDDYFITFLKKHFDFTPEGIRKELSLDEVKFEPLACYGHIGRIDIKVPWENVNEKAKELKEAFNAEQVTTVL